MSKWAITRSCDQCSVERGDRGQGHLSHVFGGNGKAGEWREAVPGIGSSGYKVLKGRENILFSGNFEYMYPWINSFPQRKESFQKYYSGEGMSRSFSAYKVPAFFSTFPGAETCQLTQWPCLSHY